MLLLAIAVLLLASQATAPPPAGAHSGTRYHLVPEHSFGNKCLRVIGTQQNGKAEQYLCNNGLDQQFDIIEFSGWHEIRFKHSNMCLDVPNWPPGHALEAGVQLEQYPCNGGDNQLFSLQLLHGRGTPHSKMSGLCLDIKDAGLGDGADVIQRYCNGQANQMWGLHNDTATRLKTTFPDRWDHWETFYTHQVVEEGLVGLWGPLISNAFANWTNTSTAVILTEHTEPDDDDDIAVLVKTTGCFDYWGGPSASAPVAWPTRSGLTTTTTSFVPLELKAPPARGTALPRSGGIRLSQSKRVTSGTKRSSTRRPS